MVRSAHWQCILLSIAQPRSRDHSARNGDAVRPGSPARLLSFFLFTVLLAVPNLACDQAGSEILNLPGQGPADFATIENQSLSITFSDLPEGANNASRTVNPAPQHGSLQMPDSARDGALAVTYIPDPGFVGTDSFSIELRDSENALHTITAGVIVYPEVRFEVDILSESPMLLVEGRAFCPSGHALPEGTYQWGFDGVVESGTGSTHMIRQHAFSSSGTHIVTLTLALTSFGNYQCSKGPTGEQKQAEVASANSQPTNPGTLSVNPSGAFAASGTQGGPFSPSSNAYTLTNPGDQPIVWAASKTQSWVTLSSSGAILAPGGTGTLTVFINATANALLPGTYNDTVTITNTTNGFGTTTRNVTLTVNPFGALAVTPGTNFTTNGSIGGPFLPSSTDYVLSNTGSTAINWTASATGNWVTLSSAGGTLNAFASTTLTVTIDADANALAEGNYSSTVTISTNSTGSTTRTISLSAATTSPAIAVWAFPDGATLTGTSHLGVVAYHASGISRIDFQVDGAPAISVDSETVNPSTGEFEYVLSLDTTAFTDGPHTVSANAVPTAGASHALAPLAVSIANSQIFDTWYVDAALGNDTTGTGSSAAPYATLRKACLAADSGDTILARNGVYDLPDESGYGFNQYVTIKPALGHSVTISAQTIPNLTLRSSYIKFEGIRFDLNNPAAVKRSVISSAATHFWFINCEFIGWGRTQANNNESALRFYAGSRFILVEGCDFHDVSLGVTATAGDCILRQNQMYDLTADGFDWDGENVLATGNVIFNNKLPVGGTQHCDFWASNTWGNFAIIRNNKAFDGDHQGQKFGGYNAAGFGKAGAVYQEYSNIAIINNLLALGTGGSVNLRFEGLSKFKKFSNVLVEHNTFYAGSSTLVIEPDLSAVDLCIRNNLFYAASAALNGPPAGVVATNNVLPTDPDPLFISPATWDFRLQPLSPYLDRAPQSVIHHDQDWAPRLGSADLGAFERQ